MKKYYQGCDECKKYKKEGMKYCPECGRKLNESE